MARKRYFGKREEEAVRNYLKQDLTQEEKNKLYTDIIHPAFSKLAENIINTYRNRHNFNKIGLEYEDLHAAGISYMFNKLKRFNPDRETKSGRPVKAYSFFGTILKRYYIKLSIDAQKAEQRELELDNEDVYINYNKTNILHYEDKHFNEEKVFVDRMIEYFENQIDDIFNFERDKSIANAVLELFRDRKNIENYNKKYLYISIREMTGEDTSKITPVVNKMKTHYAYLRKNYIKHGVLLSGSVVV